LIDFIIIICVIQVFDVLHGKIITLHQIKIKQKCPQEGWVEQDANEILQAILECIKQTAKKMEDMGLAISDIKAIGITNQRETTIIWDKKTGEPLHSAIGM
jgi:glycerol kinase